MSDLSRDEVTEYTPSEDIVRDIYADQRVGIGEWTRFDESVKRAVDDAYAEFDRWLAAHDAEVKLAAVEDTAELLQSALGMIQGGAAGESNVLTDEKAAGFQLAIDNITNYAQSMKGGHA